MGWWNVRWVGGMLSGIVRCWVVWRDVGRVDGI